MERPENDVQHKDLREWLKAVDALGDLKIVEGANRDEDIGVIAALLAPRDDSPAVLFDAIQGYPRGYRVLVNSVNSYKRIALTLGLPLGLRPFELSSRLLKLIESLRPIPPVFVDKGPVMENIITGKDINVVKFPAPKWHEDDGGRYIGTGTFDILKDPDSDWVNLGTYRVMLFEEPARVGFYISPGKQGYIIRNKYFSRNEPCPVAAVVGSDPLLLFAASTEVPYGVCEYDWAGGLRGRPYEVFKGKITGLPLPADAEIILEGFSQPNVRHPEGPFGEWPGYYGGGIEDEPVIDIKAIYHRADPIILGMPPQRPPDENGRYRAVFRSALLKKELENAGVPGVVECWCHEVGGTRFLVAVSVKQSYLGQARQVGHVASQCRTGAYAGRYVLVVDEDIDVTNLFEVIWAMGSRSDPETSIDIIKRAWSSRIDPMVSPEDRERGKFCNSRAIIDATRPWEWRDKFPKVNAPSRESLARASAKWGFLLK